ncbi:unnamed protein product [Owenia fusiformis]|uniref:Uncharacterized protein n=1 Tax=Owenia fusiformis TaxID=6347 RepID=A0A8J1U3L2_OWEFU|nr:unnamed protein product [Owenia fusiformis]
MQLFDLAVELLEEVFTQLDGVSLARVASVCMLWRNIMLTLPKRRGVWKTVCLREINLDVLIQITGIYKTSIHSATTSEVLSWEFWRDVYRTWYCGVHITHWERLETVICCKDNAVGPPNCVRIGGDVVLSGHENGLVRTWDALSGQSLDIPDTTSLHQHHGPISDMVLHRIDPLELDSEMVINKVEHVYDIVCTSSRDTTISFVKLHDSTWTYKLRHHSEPVHSVSLFGDHLLTCADDSVGNGNVLLAMDTFVQSCNVTVEAYLHGFSSSSSNVCSKIWRNQIILADGQFVKWADLEIDSLRQRKTEDNNDNDMEANVEKHIPHIEPVTINSRNFKSWVSDIIFRGQLMICITGDGLLHMCVEDEEKSINTMELFKAGATKISMFGHLFAIGLTNGVVFLLHFNLEHDLIRRSFYSQPHTTVRNKGEPIKSLDILDDGEGPVIAIATESQIKIVRWFPP